MNNVCDRLIAALFFFCPSSDVHDGVQVGKIFCRLPPKEGSQLINRILTKADLPLFAVKYNDETVDITIDNNLPSNDEPWFEVTRCGGVPTTAGGVIKVDVEMRSLQKTQFPWLPISGSSYNIRE